MPGRVSTAVRTTLVLLEDEGGKRITRVARMLTLITFVLAALFAIDFYVARARVFADARRVAREETARAAAEIEAGLRPHIEAVTGIANALSDGTLPRSGLIARLRDAAETLPTAARVGAAFAPRSFDQNILLYAPAIVRRGTDLRLIPLDSLSDYTEPRYEWYHRPLQTGPGWTAPFANDLSPGMLIAFGAPFTAVDSRTGARAPAGGIHAAISVSTVDALIASVDLGDRGYAFLVGDSGRILTHPIEPEFIADRATISDLAEGGGRAFAELAERLGRREGGVIQWLDDPASGQASWIVHEPVPSTPWTVVAVFFRDEIAVRTTEFTQKGIRLVLASLLPVLFGGVAVLARRHRSGSETAWRASVFASLLAVGGTATIWVIAHRAQPPNVYDVVFSSEASERTFRAEQNRRALRQNAALPIYVPTGLFVQSLEFLNANNVMVSGYVWQRYRRSLPAEVVRGFTLPEAFNATITESYRRIDGEDEVIGWYFEATVREMFDYSHYPLDWQAVRLRLWPKSIDRGVMLVPDLTAYRLLHATSRPGLERDVSLPGWTIRRTFFAHRVHAYSASFGLEPNARRSNVPELYFHIVASRDMLNPFFANLLPVTVAAFIVFGLLLMISPVREFNAVDVLTASAALFFVIIFAHLDLRGSLLSAHILYVEYFYFVMYGAILAVALTAIMMSRRGRFPLLEYNDNAIAKLAFWPAIVGSMLVITAAVFY